MLEVQYSQAGADFLCLVSNVGFLFFLSLLSMEADVGIPS